MAMRFSNTFSTQHRHAASITQCPSKSSLNRCFMPIRCTKRAPKELMKATSEMPVATDVVSNNTLPSTFALSAAVRKHLLSIGWHDSWTDGVVTEIKKKNLITTVPQIDAVIKYLGDEVGLSVHEIENIVSISKLILGRETSQLSAVIDWLKTQHGITGTVLKELLIAHPTLLTFDPSGDVLQKGAARASIVIDEKKRVGVTLWRDGAAFGVSPLSPSKP